MEYLYLWEVLIKNLARSSEVLLSQNVSNFGFMAAYLVAIKFANTRQLRLSFLCLMACLIVSRSLIYDLINGWQLHLIYSIIYLFAVPLTDKLKTMLALFLMALFNGLMIWDAYNYATTETWLYLNYERITACLHAAIIISCVNWRRVANSARDIFSGLRVLWLNNGYFLYN